MAKLERIHWRDADSSNVQSTFFHEPTQTICVRYLSGGLYTYIGVDQEIYMGLVHAASMGKYVNNVLKVYPYTRWENEAELLAHLNV
jgi:KTSC domain